MIPFDFEYHRPATIKEAVDTFAQLDTAGRNPRYYGGGTELISMARMNNLSFGAVVDIKDIPECRVMESDGDYFIMGAALTLTQLHEDNSFPLLAQTGARVADHTIQNKITLGGNICGTIIFKEALLPLLLTDSEAVLADPSGLRTVKIMDIYHEKLEMNPYEFVVRVKTLLPYLGLSHIHVKRTKQDKINYPLATICALKADDQIRVACSGVCRFPFRSLAMEQVLNDRSRAPADRVEQALHLIPGETLDDLEGSSGFRQFVVGKLLQDIINNLGAS
ncbi:MAG: FAD binding domain-containing protein [Syntrophomonadaceae bacterium]